MQRYLSHHRKGHSLNILWIIINSALSTATSLVLTLSTNAIFQHDLKKLLYWSGINLSLWLLFLFSDYLQKYSQEKFVQTICIEIRTNLSKDIVAKSYKEFHKNNVGQYISQYTNDVSILETNYLNSLYALLSNVFLVVFSIIALFSYHYSLVLAACILSVVLLTLPNKLSKTLKVATDALSKSNESLVSGASNLLKGFDTFFSYNRASALPFLINKQAKNYAETKISYRKTSARIENLIGAISIFSQLSILILTGLLAASKLIPVGAISSSGNLAATLFNSLSQIGTRYTTVKSTEPIIEKLKLNGSPSNVLLSNDNAISFKNELSIEDLFYSIEGKQIFKGLNLKIKKGDKVLIIGSSGIGKSTLLKIISGQIRDYKGTITIDGQDLQSLTTETLNDVITYIDQNPYLFSGSIENNITLWQKNISSTRIKEAMFNSQVDFVSDTSNIISENGNNLSVGQQQRIALARYYIKGTPIALLDEGTSALDHNNSQKVENNLLKDPERTVIEVAHKFNKENNHLFTQVINLEQFV